MRTRTGRCGLAMIAALAAGGLGVAPAVAVPETIWIPASDAAKLVGPIVLGGQTGIAEEGALGDFLVSTVCVSEDDLTGGYAEYHVKIVEAGDYHVWARLRYPHGLGESFALIPGDEKPTADPSRAIGKSGKGRSGWHWDSRGNCRGGKAAPAGFRLSLPAGEVRLRVYAREAHDSVFAPHDWRMARPMFNPRLNVICLTTDPDYVPSDADACAALGLEPAHYDEDSLRVRKGLLPKLSAEDLEPLRKGVRPLEMRGSDPFSERLLGRRGKKEVPDWLRCPRFYTKDAWRSELEFRKAGDIAFMVRQIAANEGNAFRLAAYWGGDAYFQSKVVPHAPGLGCLDYLREAVDEGRRLGVAIVMYMNPNTLYSDHPLTERAVVRRPDGSAWGGSGYGIRDAHFVCINNPEYRRLLQDVLTEAFTDYGPAGLYVDGLTPHRCFCEHCRAKYRRMFGEEMPAEKLDGPQWTVLWEMVSHPEPVGPPDDPDFFRYTGFLYQSLVEATQLVSDAVKRAKPDAVTLFHSWPKPETMPYYEGTLTEIYLRKPWRHTLWKSGELANYSNIFPVPTLFNIYLHDHGTQAEAHLKMVQGLANGCYPNCWNLLGMRPMFRFMRENAECFDFAMTTPTRFLALPRGVRVDAAQQRLLSDRSQSPRPAHDRFLAPYVGLYSALTRQGLPSVSQQRSDFHRHLEGFKVLCLANEACLSDEQVAAIRRFVHDGGGLVATHETSRYDEKGNPRPDFGLADVFGVHYESMLPPAERPVDFVLPHPVTRGLNQGGRLAHDDVHAVVRLSTGRAVARLAAEDPQAGSVAAVVVNEYGAGRVVYLPGRLDAVQCDRPTAAIERLFGNAVRWVAAGRVPVEIKAPAPVAVTLFDQPDRRLVHLVNLNGDTTYQSDEIKPVGHVLVDLRVPPGRRVTRLRQLWNKAELPFRQDADTVQFDLRELGEYEVVSAELSE